MRLVLNGESPSDRERKRFVRALSDPRRLRSSGGYLFKSGLVGDTVLISIVPAIAEGERLHHYDIAVPDEQPIIGTVSANGEFSLLFKAGQESMDETDRSAWRRRFRGFARILIESGYQGTGTLDWITRQIIRESGIIEPIPQTLVELSEGGPDDH